MQMTLEVSMRADADKRCPEDPRAVGKQALRRCKGMRAEKVTEEWTWSCAEHTL